MGCKTAAVNQAHKHCAGIKGPAKGSCMGSHMESLLVEKCLDYVCPGDPFAIEAEAVRTRTASTSRAGEGGGFSTAEQALIAKQAAQAQEEQEGGVALSDMQKYLLIGLGVVAVLAVAARKR